MSITRIEFQWKTGLSHIYPLDSIQVFHQNSIFWTKQQKLDALNGKNTFFFIIHLVQRSFALLESYHIITGSELVEHFEASHNNECAFGWVQRHFQVASMFWIDLWLKRTFHSFYLLFLRCLLSQSLRPPKSYDHRGE